MLTLWMLAACLYILPAAAEDANPAHEALKSVQLDLNNLQAGWWTGYESLAQEDKLDLVARLRTMTGSEVSRLPDPALADVNRRNILKDLDQIQALIEQDGLNIDPPIIRDSYTFEQWLELYSRHRTLQSAATLNQSEQQQLNSTLQRLKHDLSTLFVSYRGTRSQSAEKLNLGAAILQQQVSYLAIQEAHARLLRDLKEQVEKASAFQTALDSATSLLRYSGDEALALAAGLQQNKEKQSVLKSSTAKLEAQTAVGTRPGSLQALALLDKNTALRTLQLEQLKLELLQAYGGWLTQQTQADPTQWGIQISNLTTLHESERQQLRSYLDGAFTQPDTTGKNQAEQRWSLLQSVSRQVNRAEQLLHESEFVLAAYREQLRGEATGWAWVTSLFDQSYAGSIEAFITAINYPLFTVNETPVTSIDITRVTLILIIAMIISRMVRKALGHMGQRVGGVSEASIFAISKIAHYVILVIALVMGLSSIGLDFTNLALVAGALSVGIGFGLQSIFNNFISGLILLIERPLKVGDVVELESGVRGRIKAINVRSTQVNTRDNIDILVPNSEFISGRVTNYTLDDSTRRLRIPFGVAYGSDKDLVKRAAEEAAASIEYTLKQPDKEVEICMIGFGASSLDFELIVWVDNNNMPPKRSIYSLYLWEIDSKFREYNIEIPFPQQDLYVRSLPEDSIFMQERQKDA